MADQSKPKFIYDLVNIHEKTKSKMYVDWETTSDLKSLEILHLLESRGLKKFCSMKSEKNKTLNFSPEPPTRKTQSVLKLE